MSSRRSYYLGRFGSFVALGRFFFKLKKLREWWKRVLSKNDLGMEMDHRLLYRLKIRQNWGKIDFASITVLADFLANTELFFGSRVWDEASRTAIPTWMPISELSGSNPPKSVWRHFSLRVMTGGLSGGSVCAPLLLSSAPTCTSLQKWKIFASTILSKVSFVWYCDLVTCSTLGFSAPNFLNFSSSKSLSSVFALFE